MLVLFGSYLLNSTANPAQFEWKWAGLTHTAPTIFFKLSGYILFIISLRTHKPQLPSH